MQQNLEILKVICRLCKTTKDEVYTSIRSIFVNGEPFTNLIQLFCQIEIPRQENDSLPNKICGSCVKTLLSADKLRKVAQENEKYFKRAKKLKKSEVLELPQDPGRNYDVLEQVDSMDIEYNSAVIVEGNTNEHSQNQLQHNTYDCENSKLNEKDPEESNREPLKNYYKMKPINENHLVKIEDDPLEEEKKIQLKSIIKTIVKTDINENFGGSFEERNSTKTVTESRLNPNNNLSKSHNSNEVKSPFIQALAESNIKFSEMLSSCCYEPELTNDFYDVTVVCGMDIEEQTRVEKYQKPKVYRFSPAIIPPADSRSYCKRSATKKPSETEKGVCNVCGIIVGKNSLASHIRVNHEAKENLKLDWTCDKCGKIFYRKENLSSHISSVHLKTYKFKCSLCPAKYFRSDHLKTHQLMKHSDYSERQFKCPHCPRRFVSKAYMKDHLNIHSGNRPYQCEYCSKNYKVNTDLVRHRQTHTGNYRHYCDTCGAGFSRINLLASHKSSQRH